MTLVPSGVARRAGRETHIHETDLELVPGATSGGSTSSRVR